MANDIVKIVLVGASGRMGQEISSSITQHNDSKLSPRINLIGGIVSASDPESGSIIPEIRLPLGASFTQSMSEADVIIDFSSNSGTELALDFAKNNKIPLLVGTTGLSEVLESRIRAACTEIPIVRTRNTSVGVNVMAILLAEASKLLGNDFDAELVELHHKHKKDSPSGTALMLLESVAEARGNALKSVLTTGRTGLELSRMPNEIGAQAVRGGDVAGEHTVFFFGEGERIEITHRATNRKIFADGALKGGLWLANNRKPGYYSMLDVLRK